MAVCNLEQEEMGVNQLPDGWTEVQISEIATLIRGVSYKKNDSTETQIDGYLPILRATNIQDGRLTLDSDLVYVPNSYVSREQKLREGDVVVCTSSGSKHLVGKAASLFEEWEGSFGTFCAAIRFSAEVDYRYAGYFFGSSRYQDEIQKKSSGININNLRIGDLEEIRIPLAPLSEQKRIVDAIEAQFTRLDAAVAGLQRLRANLQRYRQSVLKAACEGRLVPTEAELARAEDRPFEDGATLLQRILAERRRQWEADNRPDQPKNDKWKDKYSEPAAPDVSSLPELPDGWSWATVEQVGKVQLGRQRAPQHHNGPHMRPYLRVANVFEDRIDTSDVMEMNFSPGEYEKFKLEYGDILLNEGQSPEFLGRPAMYRNEVPGSCFQNTLIRFKASSNLIPKFALTMFRSYMHNGRFQQESQITTNIAHLSAGRFAKIEFPLPPLAEQERIVKEVERRLSVIEQHEQVIATSLKRAERLRQSILKRAFAGQLV